MADDASEAFSDLSDTCPLSAAGSPLKGTRPHAGATSWGLNSRDARLCPQNQRRCIPFLALGPRGEDGLSLSFQSYG